MQTLATAHQILASGVCFHRLFNWYYVWLLYYRWFIYNTLTGGFRVFGVEKNLGPEIVSPHTLVTCALL
jgi:hypothetical protein